MHLKKEQFPKKYTLREDDPSRFIGWGELVVDEGSRTITITAKWETTVNHNIVFYKSLNGVDSGDGVADNFQMEITITDLLTGAPLAENTFTKQHLDEGLRIYFDYVVEHGYKITVVESNYEIEGYSFQGSATWEAIIEAGSTPAYSPGKISGSSGTCTIINNNCRWYTETNRYRGLCVLSPISIQRTASHRSGRRRQKRRIHCCSA